MNSRKKRTNKINPNVVIIQNDPQLSYDIATWQQTNEQEIIDRIFEIFKPFLDGKAARCRGMHDDVKSFIYEGFMYAATRYDINRLPEGIHFGKYLNRCVDFFIMQANGDKKRPKYGANIIYRKDDKQGTKRKMDWENTTTVSLSNSNQGEGLDNFVESALTKSDYLDRECEMFLQELFEQFNVKERDREIIAMILKGYKQEEIAAKFNITQSRVATILRSMRLGNTPRYEGFAEYVMDALKNK